MASQESHTWQKHFPLPHLTGDDLNGRVHRVTIKVIRIVTKDGRNGPYKVTLADLAPVLSDTDEVVEQLPDKPLKLSRSDAALLAHICESDELRDWRNKPFELAPQVFGPGRVGIEVRAIPSEDEEGGWNWNGGTLTIGDEVTEGGADTIVIGNDDADAAKSPKKPKK